MHCTIYTSKPAPMTLATKERTLIMFKMLESLAKATVAVVTIPVAVVADFVTLGGALSDKDRPYTADAVSDLVNNLKDATRPDSK